MDCLDIMAEAKCSVHSTNAEYYCKNHNTITCKECKFLEHGKCNFEYIPSYCRGVHINQDVRITAEQLVKLQETADKTKRDKQRMLSNYQSDIDERKENINSLRRKFNSLFDRYDSQLESQCASFVSGVSSSIRTCTGISDQLEKHMKTMEDETDKVDQNALLQKLIYSKDLVKMFKGQLEEIHGSKVNCETNITEDLDQKCLFAQLSSLVKPEVTDSAEASDEGIKLNPTPKTAIQNSEDNKVKPNINKSFLNLSNCSETKEIDVKVRGDAYIPCITGCCYLPDGHAILCDNYNKNVKIIDQEMNITATAPCSSAPWDVECIDDKSLVMTLPAAKSIQFISIKPGLKFQATKNLKFKCLGVGVQNNNIFVCIDNWSEKGVKILTLKGDDLSFIKHIGAGAPRYLCLSKNGRIYYAGGSGNRPFVNCVTKDGHGIFSIASPSFSYPNSIIPDVDGNILVCDKRGIHVISSEGVCGRKLLEEKNSYEERSMCLNRQTNSLIVARNNCGLFGLYTSTIALHKLNFHK